MRKKKGGGSTIVLPKPIAQFVQLKKVRLSSFCFGGETSKNRGNSRDPQGLPAKDKLGELGENQLGKLGNRVAYHS